MSESMSAAVHRIVGESLYMEEGEPALNSKRKFTTVTMQCTGVGQSVGGGYRFRFQDDKGIVHGSCWVGSTGLFRQAMGLSRTDDVRLAAGREAGMFFGVNGQIFSLNGVSV